MQRWQILIMPRAKQHLVSITDQRVRQQLKSTLKRLEYEPEKQGKPLIGELAGYRSLRAVGQRYRIIYRVKAEVVEVAIVALGIRKEGDKADIYELARKLMRLGLLEQEVALVEELTVAPEESPPVKGVVTCTECGKAQPLTITAEEIQEGNSFVRACSSCRKEFVCKLSEQDFVQAVLALFGPDTSRA